jgi:hypothetical protein
MEGKGNRLWREVDWEKTHSLCVKKKERMGKNKKIELYIGGVN